MSSLLLLGAIGLIGFLCQWLSNHLRLPAILFLLVSGILLGPVLGVLDPDALFGDLLFPYISFSVAVILFEGALTLRRSELSEIGKPVRNMVTVGVLISAVLMACTAHFVINLSWQLAALFGAIMVVTGPTVIVPMLKTVRPTKKVADVLRWEGIVIDPIGALFAVLVFEWIVVLETAEQLDSVFLIFAKTILVGMFLGLAAGYLFGLLLRQHRIPEQLQNFASLALVCFTFALSEALAHESGLLSVTVMGVLLANMKDVHIHSILDFKEDLTIVFVSALFIVLAARLDFAGFTELGWQALILLVVMQFVARPLKVAVSFWGSDFNWREKALVSWIGPRGIVAAAVSAVFALRLEEISFPGAEQLVPLAFLIIIGTVVLQSLTARPVAKLLGIAQPETHGVLIIGANDFSVQLAEALKKVEVKSLICDTRWDSLRQARISGLDTYYGNPSSEHANLHLSFTDYGYLLGLSNHREYNVMQASRFINDFGVRNVFVLPANHDSERNFKHAASPRNSGRNLLDSEYTYAKIRKMMAAGASIKVTEISEEFNYERWLESNADARALFAIKPNGSISFDTQDKELDAKPGSQLFYLSPKQESNDAVAE